MQSSSLNSLLRKTLGLVASRELTVGRLELIVVLEPRNCEGICTPETDEEYFSEDHAPFSWDYIVRGFCGPKVIGFGEVAVRQTKMRGVDIPIDRICCLDCAVQSGVFNMRKKH